MKGGCAVLLARPVTAHLLTAVRVGAVPGGRHGTRRGGGGGRRGRVGGRAVGVDGAPRDRRSADRGGLAAPSTECRHRGGRWTTPGAGTQRLRARTLGGNPGPRDLLLADGADRLCTDAATGFLATIDRDRTGIDWGRNRCRCRGGVGTRDAHTSRTVEPVSCPGSTSPPSRRRLWRPGHRSRRCPRSPGLIPPRRAPRASSDAESRPATAVARRRGRSRRPDLGQQSAVVASGKVEDLQAHYPERAGGEHMVDLRPEPAGPRAAFQVAVRPCPVTAPASWQPGTGVGPAAGRRP